MNTVPFQTFISQPNLLKETTRFLLLGSDAFLVDKAYLHIREYTQKRFHHSVELITLYGDEVSPAELGDYLDGYSIFSAHRLIVIRNGASLEKRTLSSLRIICSIRTRNKSWLSLPMRWMPDWLAGKRSESIA